MTCRNWYVAPLAALPTPEQSSQKYIWGCTGRSCASPCAKRGCRKPTGGETCPGFPQPQSAETA
eukprot:8340795-Lingulodinium_polyedra.AAC.1